MTDVNELLRRSGNSLYASSIGKESLMVQSTKEAASKLGKEWEASRRIESVSSGDKLYSVLVVGGNHPINLKSRILGSTGSGLVGRIYELQPSDIALLGTPDDWYNMRFDMSDPSTNQPETAIYIAGEVTFAGGVSAESFATEANKRGADLIQETNSQNQAKGSNAEAVGSDRILYPGNIALLEIESLDAQNISARLEIYEGELDLPR